MRALVMTSTVLLSASTVCAREPLPAGDDRGKTHKATDLRTHKTWEAMNAEHMCGGA